MSIFGNQTQSQNQEGGLFGSNQPSTNLFRTNNNNKPGGLFGANNNPANIFFGGNTSGGNSLFGNNTSSNQINLGQNKGNQSSNMFGTNDPGNQSTSLFGNNNTQNANIQQTQSASNNLRNLSGINANNNQSNNPQQNRQNYIDINNQRTRYDLEEIRLGLTNVSICSDISMMSVINDKDYDSKINKRSQYLSEIKKCIFCSYQGKDVYDHMNSSHGKSPIILYTAIDALNKRVNSLKVISAEIKSLEMFINGQSGGLDGGLIEKIKKLKNEVNSVKIALLDI
jgi:hypothetical protein